MKQSWTHLMRWMERRGDRKFLEPRFNNLFMRHHNNACEIVLNKSGEPLAAIYFTPIGNHQEEFKSLMQTVKDRIQYASDQEQALRGEK